MPYTQENRLIALETPLGEDVLLLQALSGHEGISQLFEFHLDLLSTNDSISFEDIVGQQVTISVSLADGSPRYFNGYVSRFAQSGSGDRFTHYQMEVVPWLWFLTRTADCRIFQNKTIPDIIQEVFDLHHFQDYELSLSGNYEPREYCVQYRETDFNFVARLMEQYGIFYFFQHEDGKHTLVLADSPGACQSCPNQASAEYDAIAGGLEEQDKVTSWHMEQELRTGKYSLTDYNFETPSTSLLSSDPTVVNVGGNSAYEIYDYPGEYLNRSQGDALSKLRMQEEEADHLVVSGSSVCRAFTSGYKFDLEGYYRDDMNDTYLLAEIQHTASSGESYTTGEGSTGEHYSNHFTCIPASVPFRPARMTPKPFVQGPQTALVVGKSGEEIWVDKYGRVKVQFYWDRQGKKDENSSCWIRVSQNWAGKNWGAMWIPRIGQEVIIDFLEGDPDRPLITGRVYNAEETVPYTLPDHQTVSTLQSRSSKGGASANYNEIRFEDKMGNEQIFINAERDMDLRVEVDSREFVGTNRHLMVGTDQKEQIGADKHLHVKANHFEQIDADMSNQVGGSLFESIGKDEHVNVGNNRQENIGTDQHLNIGSNRVENVGSDMSLNVGSNRMENIGADMHISVGGDCNENVGGKRSLTVGGDRHESIGSVYAVDSGQEIHLKGGMKVIVEGGMQISLKVGGNFVDIGPAGVTIQGSLVRINSGGSAGSGTSASPKSPKPPKSPEAPKPPTAPKDPETADDGSAFKEM